MFITWFIYHIKHNLKQTSLKMCVKVTLVFQETKNIFHIFSSHASIQEYLTTFQQVFF